VFVSKLCLCFFRFGECCYGNCNRYEEVLGWFRRSTRAGNPHGAHSRCYLGERNDQRYSSATGSNGQPARKPQPSKQAPLEYTSDEIMAHFRAACRGAGEMTETELLRAVAQRLGYTRLGQNVHTELKKHLRAAIRRGIIERDGDYVFCPTAIFRNYDDEFLLESLKSAMAKDREYDREEVLYNLALYLGYSNVTDAMRERMKAIFNMAIRRGSLGKRGKWVLRQE
jgi:hypothetical protein